MKTEYCIIDGLIVARIDPDAPRPVCQCSNAEEADRIVKSLNLYEDLPEPNDMNMKMSSKMYCFHTPGQTSCEICAIPET